MTRPVRRGLVITSMAMPPTKSRRLRRAIETVAPTTVWMRLVSVVRRERISPVLVISKNPGLRRTRWAKTCRRRSATTRSPIQATR